MKNYWNVKPFRESSNSTNNDNDEQMTFLREKLQQYPELIKLREILLSYGGKEIVPREEPDLDKILSRGRLFNTKVVMKHGKSLDCHTNARELSKVKGNRIATGWALSPDGLWRQHSWIIKNDNTIIETTEKRNKYFGFILGE